MAEVILLSDVVTTRLIGNSRYMGPYVLASQLEQAALDVAVIDYFTKIPDFFSYLRCFLDSSTLFVGISSTFLSRNISPEKMEWLLNNNSNHYLQTLYASSGLWLSSTRALEEWLGRLRELLNQYNPKAKIVVGGTKATQFINSPTRFENVDYLALSASESNIVEFADDLKKNRTPKTYLQNRYRILDNRIALTHKTCPETIYSQRFAIQNGEALPIEVSRGCIFNCKFCSYDKKESIRKDPAILRREFIRNYELHGTTVYQFCDDCFNDSRRKVEEVCNTILRLPFKIEWVSYARVDVSVRFPETMALMVESGAKGLFFGLESFHPVVAKNAGKGTPPDKVKEFLINAHAKYSGQCLIHGSFITGLPGETHESQRETISWVTQNDALDFIHVAPLEVPPYSPELDKVTIDFAEYTRNPNVYGFKSIDYGPQRWEHETMNSDEASALAHEFTRTWLAAGHKTVMRSIWEYPALRSMGFTSSEILDMARNERSADEWKIKASAKFESFTQNYWKALKGIHAHGQPSAESTQHP